MRREEVIGALRTRPFRPFRMHVTDGATFDVRHPEVVMVTRTAALVGIPEPDDAPPAIEKFNLVDLLHITRLEQIELHRAS